MDTNSSSIQVAGGEELTAEDAQRATRNYRASVQEQTDEVADEAPDKTEISDEQRKALDERQAPTFQAPFQDGEIRDRAPVFEIPGDRVPAYVKARRMKAFMLPNIASVHDLEKRVSAVAEHDGAPEDIVKAVRAARDAIDAVKNTYREGGHPENPRMAVSTAAKDAVTIALADATRAVAALESVAQRPDLQEEHYASLTSTVDEKRQAALDALREAERLYASFRSTVASAQVLALQQGKWDSSWHSSVVRDLDLDKVLPALKQAIAYVDPESEESDDYTTGRFLVEETPEGEIPAHTMADLRRMADAAGAGTFPWQLHSRAVARSKDDAALAEAIATKSLRVFMSSNPFQPKADDIAGGIG